jgi:hypothetical protein
MRYDPKWEQQEKKREKRERVTYSERTNYETLHYALLSILFHYVCFGSQLSPQHCDLKHLEAVIFPYKVRKQTSRLKKHIFTLRPRLHTGVNPPDLVKIKVKVTLRLAIYRQSVRLGVKPLETHDQTFFFSTELLR